jgi:hypothetical protein
VAIFAVILVPLFEELVFCGFLQPLLQRWGSLLLTSVLPIARSAERMAVARSAGVKAFVYAPTACSTATLLWASIRLLLAKAGAAAGGRVRVRAFLIWLTAVQTER